MGITEKSIKFQISIYTSALENYYFPIEPKFIKFKPTKQEILENHNPQTF